VGMPGYAPGPPVFQTGASTKLASSPKKNSGSFWDPEFVYFQLTF
jgi:hypothetical protein